MSCERFRDAITDHACGAEISADAAAHLAGCAACRDAFDAHRHALADVDAELERALSLAPSPEFLSRVQAHVRVQRSPWATPAGLAAAAAVVIAVFIAWRTADRQPSASVVAPVAVASPPVAPVSPPVAPGFSRKDAAVGESHPSASRILPAEGENHRRREGGSHRTRYEGGSHNEPDVIVPPDQLRAIARLHELMAQGVLDDGKLPPQRPEEAALSDLTMAPLEIRDIAVPDIDASSRSVVGDRERQ